MSQLFARRYGWTGADGCYSVPLNEDKVLWMFGDTWVGEIDPSGHKNSIMINNSAAWQQRRAPNAVQFFWAKDSGKSIKPRSIFVPSDPKNWYWPGALVMVDGKTLLHFLKVVRHKNGGPAAFQFDWYKDDLAIVSNPFDKPNQFKYKIVRLPEFDGRFLAGVTSLIHGDFLYVYCSCQDLLSFGKHPAVIARVPFREIVQGKTRAWQFLCRPGGGTSQAWLEKPEAPVLLFRDAAPEMSITPQDDGFLAVYQAPMSSVIFMRYARNPWGPWSDPIPVYDCPESRLKVNGKSVFVYAAKAHPELAKHSDELIISYSANPGDIAEHNARPDLYFPKFIRVRIAYSAMPLAK